MKVNFTSYNMAQQPINKPTEPKKFTSFTAGEEPQAEAKSQVETKPKDSILKRTKNGFRQTLAAYVNTSEILKGTLVGAGLGIISGAGIMAIDWLVTGTSRVAKGKTQLKEMLAQPFNLVGRSAKGLFSKIVNLPSKTFKEAGMYILKTPIRVFKNVAEAKNISKVGKIAGPLVGLGVMAACLTSARLHANQKTADLDHQFRTGHRQVTK